MSAAAKAEARRKAILSRGSDRLSKLTTSARGDDAPQFVHNVDPPPPYSTPRGDLSNFIGDDPLLAPPLASDQPSRHASGSHRSLSDTAARLGSSPPGPSVWSNEQQQQFLQTLLGGPPPSEPHPFNFNAPASNSAVPDDPLIALMSSLGVDPGIRRGAEAVPQSKVEAKPKTVIQKLLPILHVIAVWALVAFFIIWREPEAFRTRNSAIVSTGDIWNRWARLASGPAERSSWGIEIVPFFWAFVSLELALHSTRIFFNFDPTKPPLLLMLTLPYLPKPLPSILMYGLRYFQLIGTLADDLAAAVVSIGLFIAASSLYENWSLP
ncbi:hypothetical protein BGY98DRAFT_940852 [Russula aff. rugulosa BPL654]|nr:hypothetical protein BGY98DRAFT_940852 [Russula aff. rugulosa BPL654]